MNKKHNFLLPDMFEYLEVESEIEEFKLSIMEDDAEEYGIDWNDTYGDTLFLTFTREVDESRKAISDFSMVRVVNTFEEEVELGYSDCITLEEYVNNQENVDV